MRRDAIIASGAMHVAVVALAYFGLPSLFHPAPIEESGPLAVEVVTMVAPAPAKAPEAPAPKPAPAPEPPKPKAPPPPPEKAAPAPPPPPPDPEPVKAPEPESVPVPAPKPKPQPVEAPTPPKPKPAPVKEAKTPPRPKHKPKPPPPKETLASLLKDIRKDLKPKPEAPEKKPAKPEAKAPAKPKDLAKDLVADLKPTPQRAQPAPQAGTLAQHEASQIANAVRAQITPCWAVPAGAKDAGDMRIGIRIALNPDGTLRGAPSIADPSRMGTDPVFRAFAESALRALQNPRCSPLRLPSDRYATWSDMTIVFDPRELVGP